MLQQSTETNLSSDVVDVYMAFELADAKWKLGLSMGFGDEILVREVPARKLERVCEVIMAFAEANGIDGQMRVNSIYEAGFDSFWLHHRLSELGIRNRVVDAGSIETNRRGRRRKTDRLDVRHLVRKLIQYEMGDTEAFCVCNVPSRQDENDRRLERERQRLTKEKTGHRNRILGLLKTHGIKTKVDDQFIDELDELICQDGSPLGYYEKQELRREYARLKLVSEQLEELDGEVDERLNRGDAKAMMVRKLARLKGIGYRLAYGLVAEMFGWRKFKSRDQVSSYAGFDSAPYDTGNTSGKSQGISKAGNRWVRALMHSVALNWLRWQPDSHLSQWYRNKYDGASRAERKKGRVALARKLLVRLWKWVELGEEPWGAQFKPIG